MLRVPPGLPFLLLSTCFVEQSQPQWVGIGEDATDTQVFQFMRLYHMVGRCVDCGSCVSVCPMGVDLRKFLKKLDKDCLEFFGNRAGSSMEDMPPWANLTNITINKILSTTHNSFEKMEFTWKLFWKQ